MKPTTQIKHLSLLSPDGGTLAGDRLETGFDGLHGAAGVAGHALKEEQSGLLVEDCVWTATSVTCDVLLDVPSKNIFNMFLLEFSLHDELIVSIYGTTGTQLSKQEGE